MVRSISSPPFDPAGPADLDGTLRAALIESRQRMKELLELSCDFAWETDANGLFSFVTSGGALGHETLDLLGSDPADLVLSPDDARHFQADSPPEGLLVWAGTKGGAPRCLHVRARAIFDERGEFQCVRGACRDVTAEQDRDVALAAARHRERSLIQLFRALRQASDPKAAMEMGVATARPAKRSRNSERRLRLPAWHTRRSKAGRPIGRSRPAAACLRCRASWLGAWRASSCCGGRRISPTGRTTICSCCAS